MAGFLLPKNSLQVTQGASESINISVTEADGGPKDLTGATVYFTVKKRASDRNPLIQKTSASASEVDVPNPTDGKAVIHLDPADTENLETSPRKYVYDVWVVDSGGNRTPAVKASVFEVGESVTKFV